MNNELLWTARRVTIEKKKKKNHILQGMLKTV